MHTIISEKIYRNNYNHGNSYLKRSLNKWHTTFTHSQPYYST